LNWIWMLWESTVRFSKRNWSKEPCILPEFIDG